MPKDIADRIIRQLPVQPPFVGQLILETRRAMLSDQRIEIIGQALPVVRIVDDEIDEPVARCAQVIGKSAHRGKDGDDLLRMVQDIIRLLPHLHHHIDNRRIDRVEPRMIGIQLIAKDQTDVSHALWSACAGPGSGRSNI